MTGVAYLADDRADRLTTLCHQHHASTRAGVGRETVAPIASVGHAAKSIVIRSPAFPSKPNSGVFEVPGHDLVHSGTQRRQPLANAPAGRLARLVCPISGL
jgi:hypothetical protein